MSDAFTADCLAIENEVLATIIVDALQFLSQLAHQRYLEPLAGLLLRDVYLVAADVGPAHFHDVANSLAGVEQQMDGQAHPVTFT